MPYHFLFSVMVIFYLALCPISMLFTMPACMAGPTKSFVPSAPTKPGKPPSAPSYNRLVDQSDLIIIARFKVSNQIKTQLDILNKHDEDVVVARTTFDIRAILKGKYTGKTLDIIHYLPLRAKKLQAPTSKGIEFKAIVQWTDNDQLYESPREYLLFLKLRDKQYELVTGLDYAKWSVREVQPIP